MPKAKIGDRIQVIADTSGHQYAMGKELVVIDVGSIAVQAVGTSWGAQVRNFSDRDYQVVQKVPAGDAKYVVIYEPYTDVNPVIKTFSDKDAAIEFVDDGDEIDQLHVFLRVTGPVEKLEIVKRAADIKVVATL